MLFFDLFHLLEVKEVKEMGGLRPFGKSKDNTPFG
jgi:hypothetical protein